MAGIGSLQLPPREKRNHARASRVLTLGTRRNAGDEIVVVIKRARPQPQSTQQSSSAAGGGAPKVRKGDVRHAVVVRTKYPTRRPDGRYVRFDDNAAVLVNNKKEMIGNRIGGVVAAELRARGWGKIVSLGEYRPPSSVSPSAFCVCVCAAADSKKNLAAAKSPQGRLDLSDPTHCMKPLTPCGGEFLRAWRSEPRPSHAHRPVPIMQSIPHTLESFPRRLICIGDGNNAFAAAKRRIVYELRGSVEGEREASEDNNMREEATKRTIEGKSERMRAPS